MGLMLEEKRPFPSQIIYRGDNYKFLRNFKSESFDGVVIDPPFNSDQDYDFFSDKWLWYDFGHEELEMLSQINHEAYLFIKSQSNVNRRAFLTFMALRLYHIKRVLMPHGALFVFCDDRECASLTILLDILFGKENKVSAITYRRNVGRRNPDLPYTSLPRNYGNILCYKKEKKGFKFTDCIDTVPISVEKLKKDQNYHCDEIGWFVLKPITGYKEHYHNFHGIERWWEYDADTMNGLMKDGLLCRIENRRTITYSTADQIRQYADSIDNVGILYKKKRLKYENGQWRTTLDNLWEDLPREMQAKIQNGNSGTKTTQIMERVLQFFKPMEPMNRPVRILDCFLGAGTTVLACSMPQFKYDWVGMEIENGAIESTKEGLLGKKAPIQEEEPDEDKPDEPCQHIMEGFETFYEEEVKPAQENKVVKPKMKSKNNPYSELRVRPVVLDELHEDHMGQACEEESFAIRREVLKLSLSNDRRLDSFSKTVAHRIWKQQECLCACCGLGLYHDMIDADHIQPKSKGGLSTDDNCQILCPRCNRKKGSEDADIFRNTLHDRGIPVLDESERELEKERIRKYYKKYYRIDVLDGATGIF